MTVASGFSTAGHTASSKRGRMILPQREEGRHGAEVVGWSLSTTPPTCGGGATRSPSGSGRWCGTGASCGRVAAKVPSTGAWPSPVRYENPICDDCWANAGSHASGQGSNGEVSERHTTAGPCAGRAVHTPAAPRPARPARRRAVAGARRGALGTARGRMTNLLSTPEQNRPPSQPCRCGGDHRLHQVRADPPPHE